MLTAAQQHVLENLDTEFYYPYSWLDSPKFDRKTIKQAVQELKAMGFVKYARGLINDDGEVCGSGFAKTYGKHEEIYRLMEEFKQNIKSV